MSRHDVIFFSLSFFLQWIAAFSSKQVEEDEEVVVVQRGANKDSF